MLVTEKEAREKWCPLVRSMHAEFGLSWNRSADPVATAKYCNCIASDCMMWRWYETHVFDPDAPDAFGNKPGTRLDNRTYGFCGAGYFARDMRELKRTTPGGE